MNCAPLLVASVAFALWALPARAQDRPAARDNPQLPDSQWRVHDPDRPPPPVIRPAPAPDAPAPPPGDAVVLFDGNDLSEWKGRGGPARWKVEGGAIEVNGTGDIETVRQFGDCQLHVEFAVPAQASGTGQERGNSGVFLMGRYEVQILDSHGNATYADGQCAALYGQFPPDVNTCRGPGAWQTYDIVFEAPRFGADGALVRPAHVTVIHNGVVVHHRRALLGSTVHRSLPRYERHGEAGPIRLQDHGNPVRFRSVWVRPLPPR